MSKPAFYGTRDEAILGEIVPRISEKMKELGINYVATIRHAEAFYDVDKVADLFIHESKKGFCFRGSERSFQRTLDSERLFMAYNPDTTYFPNLMLKNYGYDLLLHREHLRKENYHGFIAAEQPAL